MRRVSDLSECERLWRRFSPRRTLWDEWEVVNSLYDPRVYEALFLVADDETGLLPLWLDRSDGKYYFFGGLYPESHTFWFDAGLFPTFMEEMPAPANLTYIAASEAGRIGAPPLVVENRRNLLRISELEGVDGYLATFGKKHRKNFLNDMKRLAHLSVSWERMEHFEMFIEFNIRRFGGESDFVDKEFTQEVRSFYALLDSRGELRCCTVRDGDRVVGLEYGALHDDVHFVLNGGYAGGIPNLGKLLIFEHIKRAFATGAREMDFLSGEDPWKELWNLTHEPFYAFKKS